MANRNNKVTKGYTKVYNKVYTKVYYVIGVTIYGAPIYCVHYI